MPSTEHYWGSGYVMPGSDWYTGRPDYSDMRFPTRCLRCGHVHDVALVTPTGRYSDCTMWRCPKCNAEIDDRAGGYGGSERVDKN